MGCRSSCQRACQRWCSGIVCCQLPAVLNHLPFRGVKIYTKTGDQGETGLFGGGRVPKDHPRVAAYGDVDELNSAIGLARATAPVELFDPLLQSVQRDLFSIAAHLATPDPEKVAKALEKAELSEAR